MDFTRRDFVQLAAGAALAPMALPRGAAAQTPAPRTGLTAFSQDPAAVAALRQGVAEMKARPPTDPKSWFFQAAVHGVSQEWAVEASAAHPGVRAIFLDGRSWNQCPHRSGAFHDFLVWHRAYLWHFERILREASGDRPLSVPYWRYDNAADRPFPAIFADPMPDPGLPPADPFNLPRNPLFDPRREQALVFGTLQVSDRAADPGIALAMRRFFGAPGVRGFGGSPTDMGGIERIPHNQLHFAIGGVVGREELPAETTGGLMGSVPTAAFDPVFWVHHANVDRIWRLWECQAGVEWGDFPAGWLDAAPWFFNDADGTVQNHPRRFYLDWTALGVAYDTDPAGCTPISANLPLVVAGGPGGSDGTRSGPAAEPAIAMASAVFTPDRLEIGGLAVALELSAEALARAVIPAAVDARAAAHAGHAPGGGAEALIAAAEARGLGRTVLVLDGISIRGTPSVLYDVYVNRPSDQPPSPESPHYVGTLDLFTLTAEHGTGGGDAALHGGRQVFDITAIAGAEPEGVTVEVVPVDLYVASGDAAVPKRSGEVVINSFSVERVP